MKRHLPLLLLLLAVSALAKNKEVPTAPLPTAVTTAKTVFLVNGGGSNLAFDAFYQAIKSWGKYEIVGSPEKADLIITLKYWVAKNGSTETPVTNTYTGQTTYYSSENRDPQMAITIMDARTKAELWSSINHRKLVFRWNVDKEIAKTAVAMVDELKARSQ